MKSRSENSVDPEPPGQFYRARRRIRGYLDGAFARGAYFIIWNPARFARATRSHRPLGAKHVSRVWPQFRKLSPAFAFTLVRIGRSFRWKVSRARARVQEPTSSSRFLGYLRGAIRRETIVTVDREFIGHFSRTTGIRVDLAERCARNLRSRGEFQIRRRMRSGRLSLRISPPHFSLSELPNGRKKRIRRCPGAPFFEILSRCVSRSRLHRLAVFLALHPLRAEHYDNCKVAWRFPHAVNFARRALDAGFSADRIRSAYRTAILASHADAVDQCELTPREPAAAIAYAWLELARDSRSLELRWREFFARAKPGQLIPRTDEFLPPQIDQLTVGTQSNTRQPVAEDHLPGECRRCHGTGRDRRGEDCPECGGAGIAWIR